MTEVATVETLTAEQAESLEAAFLGGLEEAQVAYERIVEHEAWTLLGFDVFSAWWIERVQPMMHALSMKPTGEVARLAIEQVRAEEADLPPAQRSTQRELAEMVGRSEATVGRINGTRSTPATNVARTDLGEASPNANPVAAPRSDGIEDVPLGTESKPDETPLPAGQEDAEAILAHLDELVSHTDPKPTQPVWSPDETELRKRLEAGETVVISLRPHHTNVVRWADTAGLLVRIDRRTEWGNPFEMPADGDRDTVIANYAEHYLPHKPSLLCKLDTLRGKALGCWCAPEACHGDVLAEARAGS